jgi:hypothetical protein
MSKGSLVINPFFRKRLYLLPTELDKALQLNMGAARSVQY